MEKDFFSELENEARPFISPANKGETDPPESGESIIPDERTAFLLFPFFIELIDQFKNTLKNIGNVTTDFHQKFSNKEFSTYLGQRITEDIKKIDLVQNSLLNYIKINTPVIRKDTVNTLIEEELKRYQTQLEEKKIKLFKKLEKNLPETAVPDDQLRYILSCLFQYVMALMPQNGSFGLFTKTLFLQRETGKDQAPVKKESGYMEILMIYTSPPKPSEQFGVASGIPAQQQERILDLALRLVDEIVQRNRGSMKFKVDEQRMRTTISLRVPIERRKVVYYQLSGELTSTAHQFKNTFDKLVSLEEMKQEG